MLISPPFLPQHAASSPDDAWLAQAMRIGSFGDGAFPLGADLAWHGGVHLDAPPDGQKRLPICAIADGTVAYVRKPTAMPSAQSDIDSHSLGYGGGWSDDGCVVIRHETEVGEGVTVRFFSISLHLKRIASSVKQGEKIWRKDEVGEAGSIYGKRGQIHFEIVSDDTNLAALVGRASGALDTSKNGRVTSLWGDAYMRLPAGTPFYASIPLPPEHVGAWTENTPLPTPVWSSSDTLIVGVGLSRVGGVRYTTLTPNGQVVGSAPATVDVELFEKASMLAKAQGAVARDVYELLRFGRVIDPLGDAASLTDWQRIAYPGGEGWVNLHAASVFAFSDADFPDWNGWRLIDDDADTDSRCDSAALITVILQSDGGATKARQAEALGKVAGADVQGRLARTVCKFPSEWEKATVATRWQWLTTETPPGAGPMASPYLKPEDFPNFKAHSEALSFWEDANLGIPAKHWHFHPREFIRVFRQCGWLSKDEMTQLFPQTAMRKSGPAWVSEPVIVLGAIVEGYRIELNKVCRRYGIVTPLRMAAFYANAMQETQWFGRLPELVSASNLPRYYPWTGRGFLQLTWPDNYVKYWRFTGKTVDPVLAHQLSHAAAQADSQHSNAPLVALETQVSAAHMTTWRAELSDGTRPDLSADCACAYWAWSSASQNADTDAANVRSFKTVSGHQHVYYTSQGMGAVAATVNVGHPSSSYNSVNGIVARFQAYNTCEVVLLDTPNFPDTQGNSNSVPEGYTPRRP